MPASVRSACARSVPAHRLAADLRPISTSFRVVPAISRRQQTRHFRVWWPSPWDPDYSRHRRALWQKYAKLRTDAWDPQWGVRQSFPPLMREMEKFEKWVRELEAEFAPQQTGKPHHRPPSWSDSCAGHAPSKRWGSHSTRFQHTGRDGPDGPKGNSGSSPSGSYWSRSRDKPVERQRKGDSAFQEEKGWAANSTGPKDHFIDPVTNKRVPRPEETAQKDETNNKIADAVEPDPSTAAIQLGPGSAGGRKHEECETLEHELGEHRSSFEQSNAETSIRKNRPSSSSAPMKDGNKAVKPIDPNPLLSIKHKADASSGNKVSLPSKGAETSAETRLQKDKPKMTGNYVKDFPEEFSGTWTGRYRHETTVDKKPSTGRLQPALSRTGESSAVSTPKTEETEPAVERRTTHDELIEQIRDIYLDSNAAHEVLPHSTSALSGTSSGESETSKETSTKKLGDTSEEVERHPDLYKILVYDPKTERVDAADATSVVPDDMKVLTPAEAVTKLSNPAHFVPYFGPLQAQGYEIISGEDDVLVFRKTREATEPGTVFLRGTRYASLPEPKATSPAVNPIDMMGSESVVPNIGNFASPTGYANYGELERAEEGVSKRKPPPPFRDASEVDYEEESKGKRRPGVLWRASVGAVWVAGLVYGGSVVSEYFTTGGENGKGSKGRLN